MSKYGNAPDGRKEIDVYAHSKHPRSTYVSSIVIRNYYGREDGYSLERKKELRREADKYLRDNGII